MGFRRRLNVVAVIASLGCVAGSLPSSMAAPGVSRRRIKIGIHAPITGAVPLASSSVERGARLYWRWLRRQDRAINRRNVRVVLRNDQSNPTTAMTVCKEMVEDRNVFLLAGTIQSGSPGAGHACARYAESVGVPYESLGGPKPSNALAYGRTSFRRSASGEATTSGAAACTCCERDAATGGGTPALVP